MVETKYGAGTQRAKIVELLLAGKKIDACFAFFAVGTLKLSTRIGEIKQDLRIKVEQEPKQVSGTRVMTYWLSKETIKQLRAKK